MYSTVQSKLLLVFKSEHQFEIDKYKVYSCTVLYTADFLNINLFCRDKNTLKNCAKKGDEKDEEIY